MPGSEKKLSGGGKKVLAMKKRPRFSREKRKDVFVERKDCSIAERRKKQRGRRRKEGEEGRRKSSFLLCLRGETIKLEAV